MHLHDLSATRRPLARDVHTWRAEKRLLPSAGGAEAAQKASWSPFRANVRCKGLGETDRLG